MSRSLTIWFQTSVSHPELFTLLAPVSCVLCINGKLISLCLEYLVSSLSRARQIPWPEYLALIGHPDRFIVDEWQHGIICIWVEWISRNSPKLLVYRITLTVFRTTDIVSKFLGEKNQIKFQNACFNSNFTLYQFLCLSLFVKSKTK